jgi:hypothetical protein
VTPGPPAGCGWPGAARPRRLIVADHHPCPRDLLLGRYGSTEKHVVTKLGFDRALTPLCRIRMWDSQSTVSFNSALGRWRQLPGGYRSTAVGSPSTSAARASCASGGGRRPATRLWTTSVRRQALAQQSRLSTVIHRSRMVRAQGSMDDGEPPDSLRVSMPKVTASCLTWLPRLSKAETLLTAKPPLLALRDASGERHAETPSPDAPRGGRPVERAQFVAPDQEGSSCGSDATSLEPFCGS